MGWELSTVLVRAVTVAVPGIGIQDLSGVGLVPDQQVVKDLAPQCADDTFTVGVRPRGPRNGP